MRIHPVTGMIPQLQTWSGVLTYLSIIFFFSSIARYLKSKNKVITYWPIVGALPCLFQNAHRVHDWTVDIANTYGLTKLERGPFFARLELLFTCDPHNVEYITKTNFSNYPKGHEYNKVFRILGDGLFNTDFDLWHGLRNLARTAFVSNNFSSLVSNLSKKVVEDELVPLLSGSAKTSTSIDLEDIFLSYTFDVIFIAIFGRNPKCLSRNSSNNEFAKAMDDGLEAVFFRHVTPPFWWKLCHFLMIGKEKKLQNAWETIDRLMSQYIALKKQDLLQGKQEQADLLSSYISFQKEGKKFSSGGDKFLRDSALTLLFAGRDTTGSALSWFFYSVLTNPVVEAKIMEELNNVYIKHSSFENAEKAKIPFIFDSEDLKGLVYLHATLCEVLRLYPSVPINRKEVVRKDVLPDGRKVKPGMTIVISMYAMARMESIWGTDCSEFKPERWIDKNGKLKSSDMDKFFTFGSGPRTCIGKDFAFTMMKLAAAALLFNFRMEVVKDHVVYPRPSLVLRMKNGLSVNIKPRVE
ncbi:Cytochrome p450 [Thalictrum thalictroides]|uniref:Cytochrome p450 n=1 Tax=Thalictrum thalictroides TaxID=46969 RepID=A0A7J6V2B5_THATH|nr:Cytochrome p450 [Thalictrum thalictroides]